MWENVLYTFLKAWLLPLKKRKPKWPDSKCFLTTGKLLQLYIYWSTRLSSFRMPSLQVLLNRKQRLEEIDIHRSIECDWLCSFLFIYSHWQTSGSKGKASSFLSQIKSNVKTREVRVHWMEVRGESESLVGLLVLHVLSLLPRWLWTVL